MNIHQVGIKGHGTSISMLTALALDLVARSNCMTFDMIIHFLNAHFNVTKYTFYLEIMNVQTMRQKAGIHIFGHRKLFVACSAA